MKYKIWNKQNSAITPSGDFLTAEQIFQQYPAAKYADYIIGVLNNTDVDYLSVFMLYEETKNIYKQQMENDSETNIKITDTMTQEEVLATIEAYENEINTRIPEPTAEERIASSLEYQNMMSMPDAQEV